MTNIQTIAVNKLYIFYILISRLFFFCIIAELLSSNPPPEINPKGKKTPLNNKIQKCKHYFPSLLKQHGNVIYSFLHFSQNRLNDVD